MSYKIRKNSSKNQALQPSNTATGKWRQIEYYFREAEAISR
jgi:hypothetical protein